MSFTTKNIQPPSGLSQPRLAIGMIARNDEPKLETTILDALSLTERVYLLDLESNDGTAGRAEELGATVFSAPWEEDFAAARNRLVAEIEALKTSDWLLWMNPGERFDPETQSAFEFFMATQIEQATGYMMVLHRCFLDSENGIRFLNREPIDCINEGDEEIIELRLMPLYHGLTFEGALQESLFPAVAARSISLSAAPGRLLLGLSQVDAPRLQERARWNLEKLERMEKEGVPLVDELLLLRASSFFDLGQIAAGRESYCQLVRQTEKVNLLLEAHYRIADSYNELPGTGEEQTTFLIEAIDRFSLDFQLLTALGLHLMGKRRIELAVRALETALNYGQVSYDVWHRRHVRGIAALTLASAYQLIGNNRLAIETLVANLERVEDRRSIALRLLEMYISENQELRARQLAATLWGDRELDHMYQVLTGGCRGSAGAWNAAVLPLELAYLEGCRHPLCLRWYSLTLLALRRFEEALPVLNEWCEAEPGSGEAKAFRFAASKPERFDETLRNILKEHVERFGITPTLPFDLTCAKGAAKTDEELAWSILGVETDCDDRTSALQQMIDNSGTALHAAEVNLRAGSSQSR